MKSKSLLAVILPSLLFLSCAPKKSKEELSHLDLTSSDHFILSVIENRKDAYADSSDYDIIGKPVFSNGDFHIINFTEQLGKNSNSYAIVLNQIIPEANSKIDSAEKSVFADLQRLLNKQSGLTYWIAKGNIEPSKDFLGDGSPDFVLAQTSTRGKETKNNQQILLYDGKRKLAGTDISALSGHRTNENKLTGVKESFEFKGAPPATIIVHHTEDSLGLKSIRYDKTWQWSRLDTSWHTGLVGTDLDNPGFQKFTKRLTYLEDNKGIFTVPENCQSGGPIYFELKRSDPSALSDYYVIKTGIEDTGYNIVFQIERKDSLTYILYKARGEKSTGLNTIGKTEIHRDSGDAMIVIKKDPVKNDIYWLTYSFNPTGVPYTSAPKKYRYLRCQ